MERSPELDALAARKLELEIADLEDSQRRNAAPAELHGKFQFIGHVDETSVHVLIQRIDQFFRRSPDATQIEILLNSAGGSVPDGLALIDYLKMLRKRGIYVRIVGIGAVFSMASAILMAADERVVTSHAWLGLHEVQQNIQGGMSSNEDGLKFGKALQDQIVALLCERSSITPAKLRSRWARKDVFIGAAEALKLGLIDRIEEV